jgi:tight adherence protein C
MSRAAGGAALGLVFGLGLLLVLAWVRARRPLPLAERIAPYLGVPGRAVPATRGAAMSVSSLIRAVTRSSPGDADLGVRLRQAGSAAAPGDFRLERLTWAVLGAVLGLGMGLFLAATGSSGATSLVLGGTGAVVGWAARDLALRRQVRSRQRVIERQLPMLADLLALGVSAGASPMAALERASACMAGPLASDVGAVTADVRGGATVEESLRSLGGLTGVGAVQRFVDGILVARERGTPIADVVRAQADDARTNERRRLVEAAGRKDVSMLIPIVFLILPTVVLIALFPGVQSLRLVVP